MPALILFGIGIVTIPMMVIDDITKGHWQTATLILPLIGGAIGLYAAYWATEDIAGFGESNSDNTYKIIGLVLGIMSDLYVLYLFSNITREEVFIYWCLPQLMGGGLLLVITMLVAVNKLLSRKSKTMVE